MRSVRTSAGPFDERPHFTVDEIDRICTEELMAVDLYPPSAGPVRIERFVEKRFGVNVSYEHLPQGLLGFTRFGGSGVESVVVARSLADDGTSVAERRINTTIAHEAGHGLLHAFLFVTRTAPASLFDHDRDVEPLRILCRDQKQGQTASPTRTSKYDGRWWEWQANRAMGALLLPKRLVNEAITEFTEMSGLLGKRTLLPASREAATKLISSVFEVNPIVARLRLSDLHPHGAENQLSL